MAIIEYLDEVHPAAAAAAGRRPRPGPRARAGPAGRLRDPSAEQPARAEVPGARAEGGRGRQEHLVPALGARGPAGTSANWRSCRPAPTATATRRRWPTAAWCRRSSTASASTCDFSGLDRTMAAFEACMRHPAFQKAQPSNCPDNEALSIPALAGAGLARTGRRAAACSHARRRRVGRPYASLNLGDHVGDDPLGAENRAASRRDSARGRCSCSRCMAAAWWTRRDPPPMAPKPTPAGPPSAASPARSWSRTACRCCWPTATAGASRRRMRLARTGRAGCRQGVLEALLLAAGRLDRRDAASARWPGWAPASGRRPSRWAAK
jgi:hypothetical protein